MVIMIIDIYIALFFEVTQRRYNVMVLDTVMNSVTMKYVNNIARKQCQVSTSVDYMNMVTLTRLQMIRVVLIVQFPLNMYLSMK